MTTPTTFAKDPDAVLDYVLDWAAWLGIDTLIASTWTGTPGLTIASDSFTDTTTTVWLSGGGVGQRYELTNHVTTAGGREDDRTITVDIREH